MEPLRLSALIARAQDALAAHGDMPVYFRGAGNSGDDERDIYDTEPVQLTHWKGEPWWFALCEREVEEN